MMRFISLLVLSLLITPPLEAQELPTFNSLEELEAILQTDLPDDFDWENFDLASIGPGFGATSVSAPEGTVNCFDYYTFGSVDIQLFNPAQSALPGVPVTFQTKLTNHNPYPLVDGLLYVKVFRAQEDNIDTQINGDAIVDAFVALEGVTLGSGEAEQATFEWTPPRQLSGGQYYVAGYFVTAERFNLAGLSFTDDIIGGKGDFTLVSEAETVYFDKDAVTINGERHQFIAAPPRIDGSVPVTVAASIKNDANEDRIVLIDWQVHFWDGLRDEQLVDTEEEAVMVPANSSVTIDYTLTDTNRAVYLITPTLRYNNEILSKLDVRLVREGVTHPRINFPGLLSYPLRGGEEATLFSCLHNGGTDALVPDTTLTLTLTDRDGATVHSYTYDGPTTGAMMGVKDVFTPERDYDYLNLTATLKQQGLTLDEVTITYDCAQLREEGCAPEPEEAASPDAEGLTDAQRNILISVVGIMLLLLSIGVAVVVIPRMRQETRRPGGPDPAMDAQFKNTDKD